MSVGSFSLSLGIHLCLTIGSICHLTSKDLYEKNKYMKNIYDPRQCYTEVNLKIVKQSSLEKDRSKSITIEDRHRFPKYISESVDLQRLRMH